MSFTGQVRVSRQPVWLEKDLLTLQGKTFVAYGSVLIQLKEAEPTASKVQVLATGLGFNLMSSLCFSTSL